MTTALGRGRILIWEGGSLWLMHALPGADGVVNATDFHAHHALQVTLSLGGRFTLRTRDRALSADCAVAADVSHAFEAVGAIAILFVEPESRAGRAIAQRLFGESVLAALPAALAAELVKRLKLAFDDAGGSEASLIALGRSLVALIAGEAEGELPDARVQKITAYVGARLDRPITLAAVAAKVGLSASRVRHLFVAQTGLPFRNYLLWLRMMKAVGLFAAGQALTQAAHEAGFSDSAHFSRTFRRMFGLPAAALRLT